MSNIIFIASVLAAVIWAVCYLLIAASSSIHIILIIAFIGVAISVVIQKNNEITKQKS